MRWPGSLTCSRVAHSRFVGSGPRWIECSPDARSPRLPGHPPDEPRVAQSDGGRRARAVGGSPAARARESEAELKDTLPLRGLKGWRKRAATPPLGDPLLFRLQRVMASALALPHLPKERSGLACSSATHTSTAVPRGRLTPPSHGAPLGRRVVCQGLSCSGPSTDPLRRA